MPHSDLTESRSPSQRDDSAVSVPDANESRLLDNPIWNSLCTGHSSLAIGNELARRFPDDIGPLSGIADQSPASYDQLRELAGPSGVVVLFYQETWVPPAGWTLIRGGLLSQMICPSPVRPAPETLPAGAELRSLITDDVPAMVELAELTEPGPFRRRTIELGAFFGIFHSGRLVSMAGQRMHLPKSVEVSAVCTHPDARGRGYARLLISAVMQEIHERGKTPFLHSFADNYSALRVYESLGFTLRRHLHLGVLKNDA